MKTLIDSSAWIDFFRGEGKAAAVEFLIGENFAITNDLILAELEPFLAVRKEKKVISLLRELEKEPLTIQWDEIIRMQTTCLSNGINGVGIPDLIIAQNALQHNLKLLTNDRHFALLKKHFHLELY